MTQTLLAIDQGTTSSRAIIFMPNGDIAFSHQIEHQQIYPEHGWVEHDPNEIWQNTKTVCEHVITEAQKEGLSPVSIGITNQRETIVAWDKKTGETLYNALVWQDQRTTKKCAEIEAKHGQIITQKTGLPVSAYFSASKMQWLLENVPAIAQAAKEERLAFGTIDSFLLWKLTEEKVHRTDITNACRTLLFNIHTKEWDAALLEIFSIPLHCLPNVKPNAFDFGEATALPLKLPIQGIAGDQQAATIGQTCFEEGMIKSTYGTGCFMMLNTGPKIVPSTHGLLSTVLYQIGDETNYALEGSIFVAGAAVQWLRDQLKVIDNASEMEAVAEKCSDDDTVYFVPAFAGLGAPYWNADARGAIVGMTLDTNRDTLIRATLDAMAYQTHDLLQAISADAGKVSSIRVDGGMVVNNWLLQRMADLLNVDIDRPQIIETTALGAAYLAGLQHGIYDSLEGIQKQWQKEKQFKPNMEDKIRQKKLRGWEKAVKSL